MNSSVYSNKKEWIVYVHTNRINNKKYVGQTSRSLEDRSGNNGVGYKKNPRFWRAIQKYGWDNFNHEIIASELEKVEADKLEKKLIKKLKTQDKQYGYNITDGGDGVVGWEPSNEWRKKNSERNKGENNPMYGKRHAEETRQKQSFAKQGKYDGSKNPMYGIHRYGKNSPNYGRSMSDEQKEKIRQTRMGKYSGINSSNCKPIFCIELNRIFWSTKQACDEFGFFASGISNCLRGIYAYSGRHPNDKEKKLHWIYVNKAIENNYITQEQLDNFLLEVRGGIHG